MSPPRILKTGIRYPVGPSDNPGIWYMYPISGGGGRFCTLSGSLVEKKILRECPSIGEGHVRTPRNWNVVSGQDENNGDVRLCRQRLSALRVQGTRLKEADRSGNRGKRETSQQTTRKIEPSMYRHVICAVNCHAQGHVHVGNTNVRLVSRGKWKRGGRESTFVANSVLLSERDVTNRVMYTLLPSARLSF